MKLGRSVLAWLGGITVFIVILFSLLLLPVFLPRRRWDGIAKALARALVACFGMKVGRRGFDIPRGREGVIIVCNHVNFLDGFLLYGHLPSYFRILEQRQHFSWPVVGWFIRRFGNIPLDQGGGGRTVGALRAAERAIAEGTSILVFPEGHRTQNGELLPFHRGAFRLASHCGAALVPIVQAGSWEVYRKGGGGTVKPGRVELVTLAPWDKSRYEGLDDRAFALAVRDEMATALAEARARLTL